VRLKFDGPLRNDAALRAVANYIVTGSTITAIRLPIAQEQVYDAGPPTYLGGAPEAVLLLLEDEPTPGVTVVGMTGPGFAAIVDFDGVALGGVATVNADLRASVDVTYWENDGLRTDEAFREFAKVGKARFGTGQPFNRSLAHAIGKIGELMSGGLYSVLASAIDGPPEPTHITSFSPAGFASPGVPVPGIGSTITFKNGIIPYHVDKLWGASDGTNRLFRTSIPFHPFECLLIVAPGNAESLDDGIIEVTRWYAPNSGRDRQIMMLTAPPQGATIIAVYAPRKSLLQIGQEIIAYDDFDIDTREAVIHGRAQLMSDLVMHSIGDVALDVWATSFLARAEINTLAFGASGRALEYVGIDMGSPRSDNPSLNDTEMRRMIFHTSCNMRGVPGTVWEAVRYIYPRLWPYIIVGEDSRWPGCIVVWFSETAIIGDLSWITSPRVEPWEVWLDEISWPDGMPIALLSETYYRDDAVDPAWYGDYYLEDFTDDPVAYPYPIVLGGSIVSIMGTPAPAIPPPLWENPGAGTINTTYRSYLVRPPGLDKALPAGCGVLLLDTSLL